MARTATVTLGDQDYTIRCFNIGELEQVSEIISAEGKSSGWQTFEIVKLAMRRADPAVDDPTQIEATIDQINTAGRAILDLAGFKTPDPPKGQETGEA